MYVFLNKREIAHTTSFIPLCEFGKSLGALVSGGPTARWQCPLHIGKQELVQALAETIAKPIQDHLRTSPFFSLCIGETTDVSVTKQLIVYARYLVSGAVHSSFVSMLDRCHCLVSMFQCLLLSLIWNLEIVLPY